MVHRGEQRTFGRRVGELRRHRRVPHRLGSDQNDGSAAGLFHVGRRRPRDLKRADDVDPDDLRPVFRRSRFEISEDGIHDLCIGGAEYLLDDGEIRGIVQKNQRQLIAYRESAIVVPAGNPAGIHSLADLARPGVRVGISMIDCLKGLWEDVTGRAGLTDEIRQNISFRATGCVAIVEAAAQGLVDAAFGWTAFDHLGEGRLEIVELPPQHRVYRGTGIGMLSFTKQPEKARQLMDFLITTEARACYQRYHWVLPETLKAAAG
jgi:molybdate transport system substrate-binding protein